jgi:hypothetical protein
VCSIEIEPNLTRHESNCAIYGRWSSEDNADLSRETASLTSRFDVRLAAIVAAARSLIALRVILDAAVERIGGPNLPRIRLNH